MNVYVESNFVLELALLQEEHESCEALLSASEARKINLILPAYSVVEPYETLIRRNKGRKSLAQNVANELQQLGRTSLYQQKIDNYQAISSFLLESGDEENQRLLEIQQRLLNAADIISLDTQILSLSLKVQAEHELSPQDSIVYASVLTYLDTHQQPSCFLNKNSKDFDTPDIEDSLQENNCKLLFSFKKGCDYIFNQVNSR